MEREIEENKTYLSNNVKKNKRRYSEYQPNLPAKKTKTPFANLSYELLHEIFNYFSLGDIYYTFYHVNNCINAFIDNTYTCLSVHRMTFRHFQYYRENILSNNIRHCENITMIKLSNEKSFDEIDHFFSRSISLYPNLKKLYLYLPNENYLKDLPKIVPNLTELYLIPEKQQLSNIDWLSKMKNLKICSITPKDHGIEISNTMCSLSENLLSLSMTLQSTYDFYTLIPLLPRQTLRCLNVSFYDSEFSYIKTYPCSMATATELTDFTFDLTLVPIRDASSLYNVIQFVTNSLRSVETLTILCRFVDGVQVNEEKLRYHLSFIYSVKKLQLFIEMNNLANFDEKSYTYPFWDNKKVHVNVYRNKTKEIQRVCICTLPLTRKLVNLFTQSERLYRVTPIECSILSNIHQFTIENSSNLISIPQSIFEMTVENYDKLFFNFLSDSKTFPTIHYLQIDSTSIHLLNRIQEICRIFPCLRSISIIQVEHYEMLENTLSKFLNNLSNQQSIIHLRVSGTFFDEICQANLCNQHYKDNLIHLLPHVFERIGTYTIALDRNNRTIDFWL